MTEKLQDSTSNVVQFPLPEQVGETVVISEGVDEGLVTVAADSMSLTDVVSATMKACAYLQDQDVDLWTCEETIYLKDKQPIIKISEFMDDYI